MKKRRKTQTKRKEKSKTEKQRDKNQPGKNAYPERSDHQARKSLLDTQGCCFQGRRTLSIRSMVINDLVGAEKQPTLL
jgi:hypothetical protein